LHAHKRQSYLGNWGNILCIFAVQVMEVCKPLLVKCYYYTGCCVTMFYGAVVITAAS